MELIGGERQIDDVCDGKDQSTIQKPVSESDWLLGHLNRILEFQIQMRTRKKTNWKVLLLEGRVSVRMKYRSIAGEWDMKFGNFVREEVGEAVSKGNAWGRGR